LNVLFVQDLAVSDLMGEYEDVGELDNGLESLRTKKQENCINFPRIKYAISSEANEVVVTPASGAIQTTTYRSRLRWLATGGAVMMAVIYTTRSACWTTTAKP